MSSGGPYRPRQMDTNPLHIGKEPLKVRKIPFSSVAVLITAAVAVTSFGAGTVHSEASRGSVTAADTPWPTPVAPAGVMSDTPWPRSAQH